jgi:hypothetical protein
MSSADTKGLITQAVNRISAEVPALAPLKLVIGLELRGRGDVQLYRVELPGPRVAKDPAHDAKVRLSLPRSHFNELAKEGRVRDWRQAFDTGQAKASGQQQILKLIANVVARAEERARLSKVRSPRADG